MGGDIYWKAEVVKMEQPLLVQLEYLLRLVAAALCWVLIGYERESRGRAHPYGGRARGGADDARLEIRI